MNLHQYKELMVALGISFHPKENQELFRGIDMERCKHKTPGCRCTIKKNNCYDSSLDEYVAYCLAFEDTCNYSKCQDYKPK